jgi:diaminopimelate decarboxylase
MLKNPPANERGHLVVGGCDVVDLANQWGTPLHLLDEKAVRERCRQYGEAFAQHWPDHRILYAGKAFLSTGMCRIIESEGLSLDVVSGGELATAIAAGFPMDRIWFHGSNKSEAEIKLGLEHRIARFVVDSEDEIERLGRLASAAGQQAAVQLRLTPGIKPSTHSYIQTGQLDSKFGFALANNIAANAVKRVLATPSLSLLGIQCHLGSQIHEMSSFAAGTAAIIDFLADVKAQLGWLPRELNLGGGLGISYLPDDQPPAIERYVQLLVETVKEHWARLEAPLPTLMIEPGRSIVGEAGVTIYRVGTVKTIPGVRTYVSVDGGMTDNPRVSLYQAKYHGVLANRVKEAPAAKVSIAGKCCESGDMIAWDLELPAVRPGDLLAIFSTGAYHYSLSSNYNRMPRGPLLLVADGHADLLMRPQTYDDLLSHDCIPQRLSHAARRS